MEAKRAAKISQQGAEFLELVVDVLEKISDIERIKKKKKSENVYFLIVR